jgi:hypothetical protein
MAITKTSRTLRAAATLAAAATANCTELNLSAALGALINVRLTNGASAPSTAPTVKIYTGDATGVKRLFYTVTGDTVNSSVTDIACRVPASAMFVNVDIINGATNAITAEAYAQELTTV